jgi:hypothetical protein
MRLASEHGADAPPSSRSLPPEAPSTPRRLVAPERVDLVRAADVCLLISPSLGEEKARELVAKHAALLHLPADAFPHGDALALLDGMAVEGGVVSVVARFAKARLLLTRRPDADR